MRRATTAVICALALLAPVAQAQAATSLQRTLSSAMAGAGSRSSAYVMDAESNEALFSWRPGTRRTLASNTKLFTSAAVLGRVGATSQLATTLVGDGALEATGTWRGDLYLRGGGDPTFGARSFSRGYGSDATVETLADQLKAAGFTRVTGRVYGDESLFDPLRGGPDSGYRTSPYVGPLSGLDFNHGYGSGGFLTNPPLYAAQKLDAALSARGIRVRGPASAKAAPDDSVTLAEVRSPPVQRLIRFQNKPSDNFFADMLMKGLAVSASPGGPVRHPSDPVTKPPTTANPAAVTAAPPLPGPASLRSGTRAAERFARTLGATPQLVDGSGLSRADRASPRSVARLLDGMRDRSDFGVYFDSLPIAGRDGTLDHRMRHGAARGRCHGKTGTLSGVSALSGYCTTRGGRTVVFSILMNGVNVYGARSIQDRMANAIAGWRG